LKKRNPAKPPVKETFNVYVKLKHNDGEVEARRLYLESFVRFGDAVMAAEQARKDPHVLAAWVEPAPINGGKQ
jgi:hypothetical protein